jgi:hypothetical protein
VRSPLFLRAFPKVRSGLSCPTYTAVKGDTWFGIASSQGVAVVELMRSNPAFTSDPPAGSKVFLPPCNNGRELPASALPECPLYPGACIDWLLAMPARNSLQNEAMSYLLPAAELAINPP